MDIKRTLNKFASLRFTRSNEAAEEVEHFIFEILIDCIRQSAGIPSRSFQGLSIQGPRILDLGDTCFPTFLALFSGVSVRPSGPNPFQYRRMASLSAQQSANLSRRLSKIKHIVLVLSGKGGV